MQDVDDAMACAAQKVPLSLQDGVSKSRVLGGLRRYRAEVLRV